VTFNEADAYSDLETLYQVAYILPIELLIDVISLFVTILSSSHARQDCV